MADSRKQYKVTVNGVEHTMLLTAEDAQRYGKAAVESKSRQPENKSGTAENK